MKKGFTLLELLIVVGIMSMLGAISVNGYRAVVRGMEERSAISSAGAFLRAARQRAQIDNKPICILWWNELLRAETDEEPAVVVGRAIAVQQTGRFSAVTQGGLLVDEFGDLNLGYESVSEDEDPDERVTMRLYNLSSSNCDYAIVSTQVAEDFCETAASSFIKSTSEERRLNGSDKNSGSTEYGVRVFGFKKVGGSASFESGDAYGFEFANITLPKGYLFGSDVPTSMSKPVSTIQKKPYKQINSSDKNQFEIELYSLRPEKGKLSAKSIGKAKDTY